MDMVLLGESRLPSATGALISPAASIAHGLWYRFSWGCSGGSCGFQDTGAAVGAAGFPEAAPVCSEVGSPNSAAGKKGAPSALTPPGKHSSSPSPPDDPALQSSIRGHVAGYPIHWGLCKSGARLPSLRKPNFPADDPTQRLVLWQLVSYVPDTGSWFGRHCRNVSMPPKQYFDISHVQYSPTKTTLTTDMLSFYGNAERELQSCVAWLASLHKKDLEREPETPETGFLPYPLCSAHPAWDLWSHQFNFSYFYIFN